MNAALIGLDRTKAHGMKIPIRQITREAHTTTHSHTHEALTTHISYTHTHTNSVIIHTYTHIH